MKTIKKLYGGDAISINDLMSGDLFNLDLLDGAISLLLKEYYFINYFKNWSAKEFEIKIPISQLKNLKMKDFSIISYKILSEAKIHQYKTNKEIQETIVSLGNKQVIIYTKE